MNARALLTGTTPGPWEARVLSEAQADVYDAQQMTLTGYEGDFTLSAPDARLMAAAPDLAARVIALEDGIRALHSPVDIEPSDTICSECSWQHRAGRFFGKVVAYPCPTIALLDKETK